MNNGGVLNFVKQLKGGAVCFAVQGGSKLRVRERNPFQMKATEQCIPVVPFITLYKVSLWMKS